MISHWTKRILTIFILFENAKGWNSSSDAVIVPTITKLQALDMWRLEMEWIMNENDVTLERNQTFEIQFGRTTNMDIVDIMNVSRGALDANKIVWTSQLPLNCVDHSVRIRIISDASTHNSWSLWKIIHGERNLTHNEIRMFPNDQVLLEGSTVMFCCIYPTETHISSMFFGNTAYKAINISPQVKAIRVENIKATNAFGVNFFCEMDRIDVAYNFVSFPPEKPQDFECETKDMRNIYCSWKIHRAPNLKGRHRRKYALLISDWRKVSCNPAGINPASCGFEAVPQQISYNVTLHVTNRLGQESETFIFNITDRVFPVPERLEVVPGTWDSVVVLQLNGSFRGLLLICQIELEPGKIMQELDKNGSDSIQLYAFRLQLLKPSTQYSTRGRCAVQGNSWGRWTTRRLFITEPLVTIDLWRQIEENSNRAIKLLWKFVSSDSEMYIEAYEVCMSNRNTLRSVCMNVTQTQVELVKDVQMCDITVRALTQLGLSVPSHITIPSGNTGGLLKESRIMGDEKGFQLTWTMDTGMCDYVVEWCMMGIALPCILQWKKVPANQTSLNLKAGDFKAGVRYAFKIYKCSTEGHRLHEKQTGYLKEQEPTQYPSLESNPDITCSSVTLKWSFNEDDPSHVGFITGYVITVQEDSEVGPNFRSFRQSVDDPRSKSFTVHGLEEDQTYTFHLESCTSAGCGPKTSATFTTTKNYYLLTAKILIPFTVLVGCCFCLWLYRNKLRGSPEKTFSFLHIKALDLDEDLYKASEMIRTLSIEDCKWCDVEILDTWPVVEEEPVTFPSLLMPSFLLPPDKWSSTGHTNFTYMSSVKQIMTETTKQDSEISALSSTDYVTSVAISLENSVM